MSDFRDRAIELEASRQHTPQPKTLRFALTMLGGCVVLSLVIGALFRQVGPEGPSAAPSQLGMA